MAVPDRSPYPYPPAKRDPTSAITYQSKIHGSVTVPDPYIGLEANPDENEETKIFVHAQAKFTRAYLDKIDERDAWLETLKQSWNYKRFSAPKRENDGRFYFEYNDGLQSQLTLRRVKVGDEDTILTESGPGGELFFDPNLLSEDGTASLTGFAMSPCGEFWVYGVSQFGSDWTTLYIRKTSLPHLLTHESGKDPGRMDDVIRYCRFFIVSWTSDSKGFFYSKYPPEDDEGKSNSPAKNCKVYYHWLGENQDNDTLIHEDPDHPFWLWSLQISSSGQYALLATSVRS